MSIRLRLALWHAGVLVATLALSHMLLYGLMVRHFLDEADESAVSWAHHIASTIRAPARTPPRAPDGQAVDFHDVLLPPVDAFAAPGVYVQIVGPDGQPVARSSNLRDRLLPADPAALAAGRAGQATFSSLRLADPDGETLRLYTQPLLVGGQLLGFVQIGRSDREDQDTLASLRLAMAGVGGVVLLAAGALGWVVAGRTLRPVASLTQTARAIAHSRSLSRRVPDVASRDELGELARTFNEMLASLAETHAAQQRFVADASHELRTPLTAVRGNLELLRQHGEELPPAERQALVQAASAEAERMARLVTDLLALARADAGLHLVHRRVELDRVLLDIFQQARALARTASPAPRAAREATHAATEGGVRVVLRELDQLVVAGDSDRLKQLLLALVDNALKYTPAGGQVSLGLRREGDAAALTVADTGIGIAPDDLPHVFERFYRADRARARDAGGTGLGLAIARWIAREHDGEISVESSPGHGSTFTVRLPLAPATPATRATPAAPPPAPPPGPR